MRPPFQRRRSRLDTDDGVLPLINVVFLLLIFFMLAGRLSSADPFEIAPPDSVSEGEPSETPSLILVAADGRMALDGEELPLERLVERLAPATEGGEARELRVKADGRVEASVVVDLLGRLDQAGIGKVMLLTLPPAGAG